MSLVRQQLTGIVHPDDWSDFWALCRRERQMYVDLMELMKGLIEALGKGHTRRQSGSPRGRGKTKTKSKGTSSGRGTPATAVIRRLEAAGRPDLALAVVEADEQQRAG